MNYIFPFGLKDWWERNRIFAIASLAIILLFAPILRQVVTIYRVDDGTLTSMFVDTKNKAWYQVQSATYYFDNDSRPWKMYVSK